MRRDTRTTFCLILLEHGDDHLQAQTIWALADALERVGG
jgi:hypothetical protein